MRQLLLSLSLLVGLPTFAVRKMANVVCFVKFADQEDAEWQHPQDYYEAMFNDSGDNANSVRNYFTDMSYGAMEWNSVLVPLVYVDSHPRSYYCKQTSINPDGYDNYAVASLREQTMLDALCKYVESSISEDAEIDCNGDGKIDNFTVIINGNSEISSNYNLWPSNQKCLWTTPVIHGKKVDCYLKVFDKANGYKALEPQELNTGVLCHEMMHTLNAFDLYSNGKLEPVGVWDLMSDNQKVPQGLSAYIRQTYGRFYGNWIPSVREISESGRYLLRPLDSDSPEDVAFKIVPDLSKDEYFMVEYRDRNDMWDSSLPAGGMLVYRVNPLVTQTGNLGKDFELYVFRPNSNAGTSAGLIKRATLGTDTRRTSFGHIDDNDYPFYSDGTRAYFCITDVKETAEGISFSFSTDITGSSAVTEIDADLIPDGKIYTLQGIRINRITSTGIYIIDGKKVFVRK